MSVVGNKRVLGYLKNWRWWKISGTFGYICKTLEIVVWKFTSTGRFFSSFFCWCGQNYLIFCRLYLQHTGILTTKTKMCELKSDQKHLYQLCLSSCWVNSGFCMCNWQLYWFVVVCLRPQQHFGRSIYQ